MTVFTVASLSGNASSAVAVPTLAVRRTRCCEHADMSCGGKFTQRRHVRHRCPHDDKQELPGGTLRPDGVTCAGGRTLPLVYEL